MMHIIETQYHFCFYFILFLNTNGSTSLFSIHTCQAIRWYSSGVSSYRHMDLEYQNRRCHPSIQIPNSSQRYLSIFYLEIRRYLHSFPCQAAASTSLCLQSSEDTPCSNQFHIPSILPVFLLLGTAVVVKNGEVLFVAESVGG